MTERDYNEGYDNGYRAGMQNTRDMAQARMDMLKARIEELETSLADAYGEIANFSLKGSDT